MNKNKKILVLDDDPDIGTMIKMMLEYKGYTVSVSDRADQAADHGYAFVRCKWNGSMQ